MKPLNKMTTSVALSLAVALAAPALAEDGPTYDGLIGAKGGVTKPATEGGLTFKAEAVFLKPDFSTSSSAYVAQIEDEIPRNIEFDFDYEFSTRYELGYIAPTSKLGWRARTWYYDTTSNGPFADDDNGLIADDAIAVSVGGGTIEDIDTLSVSTYELDMWVTDLEATYQHSDKTKFSAGLRIAKVDQRYSLGSDEGSFSSDFDYLGFGPTVEVSHTQQFADTQYGTFSFFAKARASALLGKHDISSKAGDGGADFFDLSPGGETRFAYSLEASAGIIWRPEIHGNDNFFVSAAVEYQHWGNVGNAFNEYGDVTADSPGALSIGSTEDADIDLFGFTLGVGWDF